MTPPKSSIYDANDNFQVEIQVDDHMATLFPIGRITEDANFEHIINLVTDLVSTGLPLYINLRKLTRINSCGIRDWILFVEKLQEKFTCHFQLVNELFVEQASIIPNLLGKPGTLIEAIELPYVCPTCNKRIINFVKMGDIPKKNGIYTAPRAACAECQTELEFDTIEEEYFNFLKPRR